MKLLITVVIIASLTSQISTLSIEKFMNMSFEAGEAFAKESLQDPLDNNGIRRQSEDPEIMVPRALRISIKNLLFQMMQFFDKMDDATFYNYINNEIVKIDMMKIRYNFTIKSFEDNSEAKINLLNQLLSEYMSTHPDMKIVKFAQMGNTLEYKAPEFKEFLKLLTKFENSVKVPIKTSSASLFVTLFQSLMFVIGESNLLMSNIVSELQSLTSKQMNNELKYLSTTRSFNMETLIGIMDKSFKENFLSHENFMSYVDVLYDLKGSADVSRTISFQRAFHITFVHEYDINGKCSTTCTDHKYIKNFEHPTNASLCSGDISSCKTVNGGSMQIDYSETDDVLYKGLEVCETLNGKNCRKRGNFQKADETIIAKRNFLFNCEICMCVCDNKNTKLSHRRIYNQPIHAPENEVITGLRFVKRANIIFLQIQTGAPLPMGIINNSTIKWQPLPDFVGENDTAMIDFRKRFLSLPFLRLPDNYTMTGIRFDLENSKIFGTGFDFDSGELLHESIEVSANGTYAYEEAKRVNDFTLYQPNPSKGYKIEFFFHDELQQEITPFFDCRAAVLDAPVGLSGFSLYSYVNGTLPSIVGIRLISANIFSGSLIDSIDDFFSDLS